MYNFCTLFDSHYLSRGLALYDSLDKNCESFHLYIFAFDQTSYEKLKSHKLKNATIISLTEFEDNELLGIKPTRTSAEYCWTCTPSTIHYCLKTYKLDHCTYIDADIFFYTNVVAIFEEIGQSSIAITGHNYTKKYDQSSTSGKYCVQFVYFRNDIAGISALKWWREACIDWCYARLENGKFGDQKYLDDWPERFQNVHVIQHQGAGVAPWNVQKFQLIGQRKIQDQKTQEVSNLIFYHFHGLKYRVEKNQIKVQASKFDINEEVQKEIYLPYIKQLLAIDHPASNMLQFDFQELTLPQRAILPIHFFLKKITLLQRIKYMFIKSIR